MFALSALIYNKITALINKNWVNVIKKLGDLHVCLKIGQHQIKPSELAGLNGGLMFLD